MRIAGLQKLTLLDFPGTVACTVFTGGCNFRCPFCHNAALVLPERQAEDMPVEELLRFLKSRRGLLEGVAITGGEPLLHADMPDLLRTIRAMGYAIKLDTNGSFPQRLEALIAERLVDRVAMDVKNSPALYAVTAGTPVDLDAIERSKALLLEGRVDYEFRTTVVKGLHTRESLREAAMWIRGAREYYLQQYRDTGNVIDPNGLGAFDAEEMNALRDAVAEILPCVRLRGVDEKKG